MMSAANHRPNPWAVDVEEFHLFRYLDEQAFRYNHRKMNDGERFDLAGRTAIGELLTWDQLTGKEIGPRPQID
jgi:hypothetical protein